MSNTRRSVLDTAEGVHLDGRARLEVARDVEVALRIQTARLVWGLGFRVSETCGGGVA